VSESTTPSHDAAWEEAYQQFETAEQEISKFTRRLRRLNVGEPAEGLRILELFAGRANGVEALCRLGFHPVFALDRSVGLLASSPSHRRRCAGDARALPLRESSIDVVVVQGGLHHLEVLPTDLDATLNEVARILRPGGRVYIVEPALTPFLMLVHAICRVHIARKLSRRLDALATMIELEMPTYGRWLDCVNETVDRLRARFDTIYFERSWGKFLFAGTTRESGRASE